MKTADAELRRLAQDALQNKGWNALRVLGRAAVKGLRTWKVIAISKAGKNIFVRYPRVDVYFKPKMGRLDTNLSPNQQDMDNLKKRLSPEGVADFREKFDEVLMGVSNTIEAMSVVTCQATGRTGARRFSERGCVRTLHPSVIRKLRLKEKPLSSWG